MKRTIMLLLPLLCVLVVSPYCAVAGDAPPDSEKTDASCPLTTPDAYKAELVAKEIAGVAGEPFHINFRLYPDQPPPGFFVTTLVEPLNKPEGVAIKTLTGFPKSTLTVNRAGDYAFEVRVHLIAKSSCGGVKARELLQDTVTVHVEGGE